MRHMEELIHIASKIEFDKLKVRKASALCLAFGLTPNGSSLILSACLNCGIAVPLCDFC